MSKVEDYITLPMNDWKEYQQRRKELAASHEKRRKELRKARAVNQCWEAAWKLAYRYAEQNMNDGKASVELLNSMYKAVLRKVLEYSKIEEEQK